MKDFVASALYGITPEAIEAVCKRTEHALGEVRRRDAESVREIVNWNPAFALEHVLHYAAEKLGTVPTFQEFRAFTSESQQARAMLLTPSQLAVDAAIKSGTRVDAWVGDICLSIFVGNPEFRSHQMGRKNSPARLLGDSTLRHVALEIPTRREFGTVHLPDRAVLVELARTHLLSRPR